MTERVDINRVLMQMRSYKAQAQNHAEIQSDRVSALDKTGKTEKADFSDILGQAVNKVNATQKHSSALATAFEKGDPNVSITQVMVASQKASVSFQAMTEVRNKLVDAYEQIMKMPI